MTLSDLKALAATATPGPWLKASDAPDVVLPEGGHLCWTRASSDARYIAALSPERVLALLDAIETAQAWDREFKRLPYDIEAAIAADGALSDALAKLEQTP